MKLFKRNLSILLLVVTIKIVFMPLLCKRECQSHQLFHVILHEYKVGNNTIKDSFFCTSHWSFDPSWSSYAYIVCLWMVFLRRWTQNFPCSSAAAKNETGRHFTKLFCCPLMLNYVIWKNTGYQVQPYCLLLVNLSLK